MQKAIEEGKKLIDNYPETPQYSTDLARLLIANEKNKSAKDVLEKAIDTHPNDGQAMMMLAQLYKASGAVGCSEPKYVEHSTSLGA